MTMAGAKFPVIFVVRMLNLLMISKYYERIGDHATNIAEWVIYSVTGTH